MRSIFTAVFLAAAVAVAQDPQPEPAPNAEAADAGSADGVAITVAEPVIEPTPWWRQFKPFGYAKVGVFYTLPPREEQIPGGNGGFRVASLRIGAIFKPIEDLEVVASIDGAVPMPRPEDPTSGSRIVALRDAYAEYAITDFFLVRAGQFKAPYWAETLLSDSQLPFTTRSVVSEGYTAPEFAGQREGMSLDRQVGIQLSSRRLGSKAIGFKYAVAVVNGNGANQLLNDNNIPAPVGRLELELLEHITIGVNGFYNSKSEGVRPNRLVANQLGYGADLLAQLRGFSLLVGYLGRSTTYPSTSRPTDSTAPLPPALPADSAMGFLVQPSYAHQGTGLGAGLRLAVYDPSSADAADNVIEISAMLAWQLKAAPVRVLLQYTHREEAAGVAVANDAVDAMLQVTW